MEEHYYEVSGHSPCGRYVIVFPAQTEEEAIRLFAKSKPHVQYITAVNKASKAEYETQENNKKESASRQEKTIRWNKILKEFKKDAN